MQDLDAAISYQQRRADKVLYCPDLSDTDGHQNHTATAVLPCRTVGACRHLGMEEELWWWTMRGMFGGRLWAALSAGLLFAIVVVRILRAHSLQLRALERKNEWLEGELELLRQDLDHRVRGCDKSAEATQNDEYSITYSDVESTAGSCGGRRTVTVTLTPHAHWLGEWAVRTRSGSPLLTTCHHVYKQRAPR